MKSFRLRPLVLISLSAHLIFRSGQNIRFALLFYLLMEMEKALRQRRKQKKLKQ